MSNFFLLSGAEFLYVLLILERFSIVNQHKTASELNKTSGDKK